MVDQPQVQVRISVEELEALDQVRTVLGERTYGIVPSRGEIAKVAIMEWVTARQREFSTPPQGGPPPVVPEWEQLDLVTTPAATESLTTSHAMSPGSQAPTLHGQVLACIPSASNQPEGIDRAALQAQTGLTANQVYSALHKLHERGQIVRVAEGHYVRSA